MLQVKLVDKTVLKSGTRAGQIMALTLLSEEEKNLKLEDLKKKYLSKDVYDESYVYQVVGVSNAHVFVPGPPVFGLLLKEKSRLVGEYENL